FICCQQARTAIELGFRHHDGVEGKVAIVGIFITPVPLVASRFDCEFRCRDHELFVEQAEGGNDDDDQDHDRHDGPCDFEPCVMRGLGGGRVCFAVEAQHHVDEQHG